MPREVLIIAFGALPLAQAWLGETCAPFRLLLDPERRVYQAYELERSLLRSWNLKTVRRYVQLMRTGRRWRGIQGDSTQPGGRLGLTDMTVSGLLPDDIQTLLAWVTCVAGAGAPEDYMATLREAGFTDFTVEDQRGALLEMVNDVRRKLLGVELAAGLGKMDLGNLDLSEGKRLARRAIELIEDGTVGYTLITARKNDP